jgi:hypothetical protein
VDPYPDLSREQKNIINRVFGFYEQNLTLLRTWGVYLFDSDFDKEEELKNKISIVFLGALFDLACFSDKRLLKIETECKELELHHMPRHIKQAGAFILAARDVLQNFTPDEQALIQNLRNQWVHSYLDQVTKEKTAFKCIENWEVKQRYVTNKEYHDILRPFFEQGQTLDEIIIEFRSRFLDAPTLWSQMTLEFQNNKEAIQHAMCTKNEYDWECLIV